MESNRDILSSKMYATIRIDFTKGFPVIIYGDNSSGRKTKKLLLRDFISTDDLPALISQIDEIIAGNQTVLQAHCRVNTDGDYHWILVRCELKKEKFGKTHLEGFIFDVSSYLDFADEDRALLEYKRKEDEKSERISNRNLTLVEILDRDYLKQIQVPLAQGGVFSAIYDDDGNLICSPEENNEPFLANKYRHTKKANIRISHVIAAHWIISAPSEELIELNAPLLEVLVQAVSRTANSFVMLYNEMNNSEHANKLLSEHIEQQILTNNVYNIIMERKDSSEALDAVIKLVGEYMGMKRICIYEDLSANKSVRCIYQWQSAQCADSAELEYSYVDFKRIKERLDYTDMYLPCGSSVNTAVENCVIANLNGDGKRLGIITFLPNESGYVPTAQESKVLRSVSQITATLLQQKNSDDKLEETDKKLIHLAFYDPILDIPNRTKLDKDLDNELKTKDRGAAAVVKITNLHTYNELFGHEYTDNMLFNVAKFIETLPVAKPAIYRFEGNTLMLMLRQTGEEEAKQLIEDLLKRFKEPWKCSLGEHFLDVGIGVTMFLNGHKSRDEVYRAAALALYKATEYGTNSYAFHTESFNKEADVNYAHAQKLRDCVSEGMKDFKLKYQPIYEYKSYDSASSEDLPARCETFLSWDELPTIKLIQLAENMGFDIQIDRWVIENACAFCKKMQQDIPEFSVSVNITPRELRSGSIVSTVKEALMMSGLKAEYLTLEIPERAFSRRLDGLLPILKKLKKTGVRLVIDSFGDFESFGGMRLLKHSYISMVKIDAGLFTNIFGDFDEVWVETVVKFTSFLDDGICVKKVEDKEQLLKAGKFGVKYSQGYMFAKPMTEEEIVKKYKKK